jgi:hypothetical protein
MIKALHLQLEHQLSIRLKLAQSLDWVTFERFFLFWGIETEWLIEIHIILQYLILFYKVQKVLPLWIQNKLIN